MNEVEDYLSKLTDESREVLELVRKKMKTLMPDSIECISYGILTYKMNKKNIIHFGGYKNHIGIYPGSKYIEENKDELNEYKTSKGTIQVPIDIENFPFELIKKIIQFNTN